MNDEYFKKGMVLRNTETKIILIVGDFLVGVLGLLGAAYLWARPDWLEFSFEFMIQRVPSWFFILPLIWVVMIMNTRDPRKIRQMDETIKGILISSAISIGLYLIFYFASEPNSLPRLGIAYFIGLCFILTLLWRFLFIRIFTSASFQRRVLIVGAGKSGTAIGEVIKNTHPAPFIVIGYLDDDPKKMGKEIEGFPVIGLCDQLLDIIRQEKITDIIFSISKETRPELFKLVMEAAQIGVEVISMPTVYEELLERVPISHFDQEWLLRFIMEQANQNGFYEMIKRAIDIIGAAVGLFFTVILIIPFVSLAIIIESGFPVFYLQTRVGENGKLFNLIKFRTMIQDAEKDGEAVIAAKNDKRVTRVGRILRKARIDELPQVINILLGHISWVGPRAERPELFDKFEEDIPFYRARLLVKPGASGWAQINFGYPNTIEEMKLKLEYDLYYVKHKNLLLDFNIILRTIITMFGFRGQ